MSSRLSANFTFCADTVITPPSGLACAAFNSAWEQYDRPEERRGERSREETAHAVAWSAVEQKYAKDSKTGKWAEKK